LFGCGDAVVIDDDPGQAWAGCGHSLAAIECAARGVRVNAISHLACPRTRVEAREANQSSQPSLCLSLR
jgi:hypothetical protein